MNLYKCTVKIPWSRSIGMCSPPDKWMTVMVTAPRAAAARYSYVKMAWDAGYDRFKFADVVVSRVETAVS